MVKLNNNNNNKFSHPCATSNQSWSNTNLQVRCENSPHTENWLSSEVGDFFLSSRYQFCICICLKCLECLFMSPLSAVTGKPWVQIPNDANGEDKLLNGRLLFLLQPPESSTCLNTDCITQQKKKWGRSVPVGFCKQSSHLSCGPNPLFEV